MRALRSVHAHSASLKHSNRALPSWCVRFQTVSKLTALPLLRPQRRGQCRGTLGWTRLRNALPSCCLSQPALFLPRRSTGQSPDFRIAMLGAGTPKPRCAFCAARHCFLLPVTRASAVPPCTSGQAAGCNRQTAAAAQHVPHLGVGEAFGCTPPARRRGPLGASSRPLHRLRKRSCGSLLPCGNEIAALLLRPLLIWSAKGVDASGAAPPGGRWLARSSRSSPRCLQAPAAVELGAAVAAAAAACVS